MTIDKLTEQQQLALLTGHRLGPYLSYNPVNRAQIWQWCSAMGDHNPCYLSAEELFAPPAMMQMWTMRDINDAYAPGSTDAPPYQVFDDMKALGYPDNVAVSYDISFHRRLREGEQAKHYTTVVNISERKTTALGAGFFVTERVEYLSLEGTLFAEALITYFQYRAAVKKATEVATRKSKVLRHETMQPEGSGEVGGKAVARSYPGTCPALSCLVHSVPPRPVYLGHHLP